MIMKIVNRLMPELKHYATEISVKPMQNFGLCSKFYITLRPNKNEWDMCKYLARVNGRECKADDEDRNIMVII